MFRPCRTDVVSVDLISYKLPLETTSIMSDWRRLHALPEGFSYN